MSLSRLRTPCALLTALTVLALGGRPVVGARQAADPTGRQIVSKHVEAIGGSAAFKALRSVRAIGRLEIPAQQISGDFEFVALRPNKQLTRATLAGIGRIETAYDGTHAWTLSPIAGPSLLAGRELEEEADDAWFDSALYEPTQIRELTTLGRASFDGHDAFKVKVVSARGIERTTYFDVTTFLELGSEAQRASPQGVIPTTTILRNYRKFGGVMFATTQVQRAVGTEIVTTIASYTFEPVAASMFVPPPEIKALIK